MLASCPYLLPLFSINVFFAKVILRNADTEIALDFFASSVVCHIRVGSKIKSHFICKMSSYFRTFVDRLCEVIFERSLWQPFIEHSVFRDIRNEVSRKTGLNNPEGIYFLIKENL